MKLETFFEKFDLFADAPGAVAKMRELVLQLAVQGKLVDQNSDELPARDCIRKANKPIVDVAPDESIQTPVGWVALPLGCLIASNTGGGTPSKANPDYWNGSIPWASVKDVQSEKFLVSTIDSITEEGLKSSSSNLIPPGRLLVVTRMGLGKLAINNLAVAINQDLRAIEPTTALDIDFAYLLFKSLKLVGSGVTVKGITVDKLHAMPVVIPPLAEQKRIVAKVDELMALCDRLEAQQQERETRHAALARASLARFANAPTPSNLPFLFHPSYAIPPADLRRSILTLAVQGKLVPQDPKDESALNLLERIQVRKQEMGISRVTMQETAPSDSPYALPAGWLWSEWDRIALKIGDIDHKMPAQVSEGIPYVSPRDFLPANRIDFEGAKRISRDDYVRLAAKIKPENGDLIYPRYGTIGENRLVTVEREFLASYSCAVIKTLPELVDPRYQYFFSISELCRDQARAAENKTTQANVGIKSIKEFLFPLPPLAEQRRIVVKVEQLMALVDELETQLAASRTTAAKLLSALVAELTTQA